MRDEFLTAMGDTLRARRRSRGLTQPQLAGRLGRSASRISELERDLLDGRVGKDRLGLLAEVCDALQLVPILVPLERAQEISRALDTSPSEVPGAVRRAFDDLFVDLSDPSDPERR